jgi:hypothetical protein
MLTAKFCIKRQTLYAEPMNVSNGGEKVVPLKLDVKNAFVDFKVDKDGTKSLMLSNGIDKYTFYSETEEDLKKWYSNLTKWCV